MILDDLFKETMPPASDDDMKKMTMCDTFKYEQSFVTLVLGSYTELLMIALVLAMPKMGRISHY